MMEFKMVEVDRLAEIVEVNKSVFEDMYDWPIYELKDYQDKLKDINPIIFIVEENGKIIGNSIAFEKDNGFYLWILGVLKEYRNQGIASKLLDLREEYARIHGYKKIFAKVYDVSKDMLILLGKRGYKIVDTEKKINSK